MQYQLYRKNLATKEVSSLEIPIAAYPLYWYIRVCSEMNDCNNGHFYFFTCYLN